MAFFDRTAGIETPEDKYKYVRNHFRYYTMNSWNKLKSIANNVKVYAMKLSNLDRAWEIVNACDDWNDNEFYRAVHTTIADSGLRIGFNGRSGGYLVLYNPDNNCDVCKGDYFCENYEDAVEGDDIDRDVLERDFKLVQRFDRLCDQLRDMLEYYIKRAVIDTYDQVTVVKKTRVRIA